MFGSYIQLKQLLYIGMTLTGIILVGVAAFETRACFSADEGIIHALTALISFLMGSVCVFFGLETYILRDDPDIWR